MNQGIDQLVAQRMGSAGGNPQALQQQYKQSGDIVTLIAMQKMKTDLERKAQETHLQMQTTPQTIAQQREQEVLGLTKQEVSQQLQPGIQQMGQQMAQAQAPQGPPQGIASVPRPPMGMAAGGIVAFQGGGSTSYPEESDEEYMRAQFAEQAARSAEEGGGMHRPSEAYPGTGGPLEAVAQALGIPVSAVQNMPKAKLRELMLMMGSPQQGGSGQTTTRIPQEPRRIYGDELPVMPPNGMAGGGVVAFKEGDKVPAPDGVYEEIARAYNISVSDAKTIPPEKIRQMMTTIVNPAQFEDFLPAGETWARGEEFSPTPGKVVPPQGISPEQGRINQYGDIGASIDRATAPSDSAKAAREDMSRRMEQKIQLPGSAMEAGQMIGSGIDSLGKDWEKIKALPGRALDPARGAVTDFMEGMWGTTPPPKSGPKPGEEFPATPDLPPEPDAKEAAIQGSGIGAVANAQGTPSEQGTRRSDLYKWLGDKRNASAADAQARAEGNFSKHTAGSRGIAELLARREQQMQDAITKQQDPETLRRNKLKATLLGMGSSNSQYASNAFARGLAGSMNEQSRQDKDQLGGIATLNKMAGDRMDKLRPLEEGVFNAGQSAYDTTNDNAYKNALTEAQMSNADQVAIGQAEENRLRALAADLTKQGMVDGKTDTAIRGAFGELEKINNRVSDKLAEDGEYIAANAEMQRGIEEGGKSGQKRIDKAVARIVDAKRRVQEMEGYAPAVSKIENWLKTLYTRSGVPQPPESAAPLQGATMKQIQ